MSGIIMKHIAKALLQDIVQQWSNNPILGTGGSH